MTTTDTAPLMDALDAASEARARKDTELEDLEMQLGEAELAAQRLRAVMAEVAYERDELAKVEDAAYEAFTAAGGRLDLSGYETRYAEYGD